MIEKVSFQNFLYCYERREFIYVFNFTVTISFWEERWFGSNFFKDFFSFHIKFAWTNIHWDIFWKLFKFRTIIIILIFQFMKMLSIPIHMLLKNVAEIANNYVIFKNWCIKEHFPHKSPCILLLLSSFNKYFVVLVRFIWIILNIFVDQEILLLLIFVHNPQHKILFTVFVFNFYCTISRICFERRFT